MNVRKFKSALCLFMVICAAVFGCACVPEQIKSVEIEQKNIVINAGESKKLSVKYNPPELKKEKLNWVTSNSGVAKVSDGEVQAISRGTAEITAVSNNGKRTSCTVKVKDIKVERINITEDKLELSQGETHPLSADIYPTDATQEVKWKSSDRAVAVVSQKGVVTAVGMGKAVIVCKVKNGAEDSCPVNVNDNKYIESEAKKNISPEVLENLPFDYKKLNVPLMAKTIKKRYRYNLKYAVNKFTSGSVNKYGKGKKTVNMIEIPRGEFDWDYDRRYFYKNDKLYFACVSRGKKKHKIYYYKDTIIRYVTPDKVVTDFEQGIECKIGEKALKEAYRVY